MMSAPHDPVASQLLKLMKLLTAAIAAATLLYLTVVLVMVEMNGPLMPELNNQHTTLLVGMMILAFAFLLASRKILANGAQNAMNLSGGLADRMKQYQKAFVIHLFIIEVPTWITLTMYLVTGSFPFLALGAVLLGLILSSWPGKRKLAAQLGLDSVQLEMLTDPKK